jgi:hypothetical protein
MDPWIVRLSEFFRNKCESNISQGGIMKRCSGSECRYWDEGGCLHPENPGNKTEERPNMLVA